MQRCSALPSFPTKSTAASGSSLRRELRLIAHNPEQEEAVEEVEAKSNVDQIAVGFNVMYLLDALNALRAEEVTLNLRDANSSALVREGGSDRCRHVVMPLRI